MLEFCPRRWSAIFQDLVQSPSETGCATTSAFRELCACGNSGVFVSGVIHGVQQVSNHPARTVLHFLGAPFLLEDREVGFEFISESPGLRKGHGHNVDDPRVACITSGALRQVLDLHEYYP